MSDQRLAPILLAEAPDFAAFAGGQQVVAPPGWGLTVATAIVSATRRLGGRFRELARSQESGMVMTEFAIVFPVQLFLSMLIFQFALINIAHVIVNHAAFMSARAVLVADDSPESGGPTGVGTDRAELFYANEAAATITATIAGNAGVGNRGGNAFVLPGLGRMPRRNAAAQKTRVQIIRNNDLVAVEVQHDYQLIIPVAALFFRDRNSPRGAIGNEPHTTITEYGIIPRPWQRINRAEGDGPDVDRRLPTRFEAPIRPPGRDRFTGTLPPIGLGEGSQGPRRRRNRRGGGRPGGGNGGGRPGDLPGGIGNGGLPGPGGGGRPDGRPGGRDGPIGGQPGNGGPPPDFGPRGDDRDDGERRR